MKNYLVTFVGIILPNSGCALTVQAMDAEDAQEIAIETLEQKGICVPSIKSIKKI
jgi:hypothetical protein